MRIKRIKRLRNCGIFRDFSGDALPEFAKFNLIYGQNWSGKTTLSRVLRSLELQKVPDGEVLISTDKPSNIRGNDFPSTSIPIRVFNNDFVRENVFSIKGNDIPPIIILGLEDKEKRDQLDEKRRSLEKVKMGRDGDQANLTKRKTEIDRHCIACGQTIKEILRGPGQNNYNNYNKGDYHRQAELMLDEGNTKTYLCEDDDMQNQKLTLYRTISKLEISEPSYPRLDLTVLQAKVAALLVRTVSTGVIRSLREDPERVTWVRKGLDFQIEQECPFCEQQVPERRQLDLEHHFSTEYKQLIKSLDELAIEINNTEESYLCKLKAPNNAKIHEHLSDAYDNAKADLESYYNQVKEYLNSLTKIVSHKRDQPFDMVSMDDMPPPPDDNPTEKLIEIIRQHNDTCKDHAKKVAEAGKWLELRYVAKHLEEFRQMRDAATEAGRTNDESKKRVAALDAGVSKLELEVSDYRRSADALNADLSAYLGHGELRLTVHENGYIIMREGNDNPLPSEGEKTAIALLYFLTSLQRDGFDIKNSIIVLDDPVSSLDANSLFAAYGFIRKHTSYAGQLFILTHNFTFFREVREWFGNKKRSDPPRAQFYMLDSVSNGEGRRSEMLELDPLLKDYGSDYHYLFARVWRGSQQTDKLESYYPLSNMARRLLEAFLAFRLLDIRGALGNRMDRIDFDKGKKRRILAFVNAHSHNDTVGGQEHNTELLSEAPEVLTDIMDLINVMDSQHHSHMMNLINQT